jgi:hypothetical protein
MTFRCIAKDSLKKQGGGGNNTRKRITRPTDFSLLYFVNIYFFVISFYTGHVDAKENVFLHI